MFTKHDKIWEKKEIMSIELIWEKRKMFVHWIKLNRASETRTVTFHPARVGDGAEQWSVKDLSRKEVSPPNGISHWPHPHDTAQAASFMFTCSQLHQLILSQGVNGGLNFFRAWRD